MDDLKQASKRRLSFVATVKAVLWSFFGVRKKSDYGATQSVACCYSWRPGCRNFCCDLAVDCEICFGTIKSSIIFEHCNQGM